MLSEPSERLRPAPNPLSRRQPRIAFESAQSSLDFSMIQAICLAETEGFEPSIGLYDPITV